MKVLEFKSKRHHVELTGDIEEDARVAPPLGLFDRFDIMESVFWVNFEFLNIGDDRDAVDKVEFFCLPKDPNTVLVDIDALPHNAETRGHYKVDLGSYELIKLSDKPLKHFL